MSAETANRDDGCDWYFGVPFPSKRKVAEAAPVKRELKVGDRVKVVKRGEAGSGHGASVGDIGKVFAVDHGCIYCEMVGGPWYFNIDEIELLQPTFAPNTRVRLIRNTQRYAVGDTGTVTLSSDESVGVRMDDGRYWSFKPEDLAVVPEMRGASLAEQADVGSRHDGAVTAEKLSVASLCDLAPGCAGRNGEHGKPKFKAGDVVQALVEDWSGAINAGDIFTLSGAHDEAVEFIDREGDDRIRPADEFELVTSAPCPQDNVVSIGEFKANLGDVAAVAFGGTPEPCIVIRQVDGQPRPSSWPHVHKSAADATKEAERLASVNPGKQFDVYQRVTGRVGDVQVREVA
jgi:hypothetical protein